MSTAPFSCAAAPTAPDRISRPQSPGNAGIPAVALAVVALLTVFLSIPWPVAPVLAAAGDEDSPLIGSISIVGNVKTDETVIRRELGLTVGDPFPEEDLDNIWDHLEDVGYFAFVDMEYEENDDGFIDLTVIVEEDRTTRLAPLLRYSRRHKYLIGAMLNDTNLRGKGEKLDLSAVVHRIQRFRAGWQRPWFLGMKDVTASLDAGWERGPFVYRPTDYTQAQVTGRLRVDFPWHFYVAGGCRYRGFELQDTFRWRDPHATAPNGEEVDYPVWLGGVWRRYLEWIGEVGWDNRDMPYYPTRGGWWRFVARAVSSYEFRSYTVTTADLRQFVPLYGDHILALRAWGRRVDGPLPLEDRLYWGGPETLRGYGYARFEGEEGYLLTCEYRWPLFLMPISPNGQVIGIGIHFFADAGDTWFEGRDAGDARFSWGAGIHFNVATLQFRFEYARTEDGDSVFQFADTFNF